METKLTHILDDLTVEEVSQLLDSEFTFPIDKSIQNRIIKSTKKKFILDNECNNSRKFQNALSFIFARKRLAYTLATFTLFIGLGFGSYIYLQIPSAYVSLDINPSIELGINRFEKVVTSEAYNADGQKILDNTKYKHLHIESAVNNVLASAIEQSYIANEKSFAISIATISNDDSTRGNLEKKLKKAIHTSLYDNNINTEVDIISFNSNSAKREEAKALGVTSGKLNLIQELMSLSTDIKFEDYKDKSIIYIQNKIKELKNIKISSNLNNTNISSPQVTDYVASETKSVNNSTTENSSNDSSSDSNIKSNNSTNNNVIANNNSNNDNFNNSGSGNTDNSVNNNGNRPNNKPTHGNNHKANNKPNNVNKHDNGNKYHDKHNNCNKGNG